MIDLKEESMNQITMIKPYMHEGEWVFDDLEKGLVKEMLVAGMPEIIDLVCQDIPNYKEGFKVFFSKDYFPGANIVLDLKGPDEFGSGNYYYLRNSNLIGWLCPALFKYFEEAPKSIHIQVKNV